MDVNTYRFHGPKRIRREDHALITGNARYTDDIDPSDVTHAAICRGWFGHAAITDIDTSAAEARDGVIAVYTAADLPADAGTLELSASLPDQHVTPYRLLAADRVRYAGEAVAVVVAEDRYVAHDAADLVSVEYDPLEAVTDADAALESNAPLVHEDLPNNCVFDHEFGDMATVDTAFESADHTISINIGNQRLLPDALEPRAALADYDLETDELEIYMSTQTPHRTQGRLSKLIGLPSERVRVIAPDVGGGFGSKGASPYADEPLAAWCSMQLKRPVKWVGTRSESHQTDHHGRDLWTVAELAFDADGTVRGLRIDARLNIGAYALWNPVGNIKSLISGAYDIPAISGRVVGALTNTAPVAPYRGAGRPETIYIVERLFAEAAAVVDIDPVEFRRRNLIPADAFPYETALGEIYDSGDYESAMDRALELIEYEDVRERQDRLRKKETEERRYLGIGIGTFVENTGSGPSTPEMARLSIEADGTVTAVCGTADHGQGHATTFAQVISTELGIPYEDVEIMEGDTKDLPYGGGTYGSRSATVGASALIESAQEVKEQSRRVAADWFEASVADIEFDAGEFHVAGVPDSTIHIGEIARAVHEESKGATALKSAKETSLEANSTYDPPSYAFAFGTHVAVVVVDSRSGEIDIERYVAVDDCGVQFNPLLVEGQIHGGIAQGIGQALSEHAIYDENGTLRTGSLQDYALPRATDVPELETDSTVTPCPHNPSGAKGAGESGTIGAPPAVVNAVVDALRPLGVTHIDMPLTEETVWRAIQDAERDQ